jgi:hypothetical protein
VSAVLPYDLAKTVVGAVRILWAPITQTLPTKVQDVHAMTSTYAAAGTWKDFGAQKSVPQYNRDINVQGNQIQQETGDVFEEVTEVKRSFRVPVAEITPETLQIIENAPSVDTIAAASGAGSQKGLAVGSFTDLNQYRIYFVGRRKAPYGAVTEPGGLKRGPFVGYVGYRASLSADAVNIDFEKGNLAEAVVTFDFFPEPGQPSGQEYGKWLFEDAPQTIT